MCVANCRCKIVTSSVPFMARWGSMLILLHHLRLDSWLPRVASQESKHEVGGKDPLFQSKGRSGGEGQQCFVPESLQEARSLAGEVSPHHAATQDRELAGSLRCATSYQSLTSHGKPLMGPFLAESLP